MIFFKKKNITNLITVSLITESSPPQNFNLNNLTSLKLIEKKILKREFFEKIYFVELLRETINLLFEKYNQESINIQNN